MRIELLIANRYQDGLLVQNLSNDLVFKMFTGETNEISVSTFTPGKRLLVIDFNNELNSEQLIQFGMILQDIIRNSEIVFYPHLKKY